MSNSAQGAVPCARYRYMPSASWIGAAAACAALTTIVGCGPARTTSPDIALAVNVESSPGQSDVTLIGTGGVCDGQLDIDASVDAERRVITLSGEGEVPDNEFGYCSRYIDTGGEGRIAAEKRTSVELEPGVYTLKSAVGSDSIEFDYHNGVVTSSDPYPTFALQEKYAPQRDETVAAADWLNHVWPDAAKTPPWCAMDDKTDPLLTTCRLSNPQFVTEVGAHPIPLDALSANGCVTPVESTLGDVGGKWELTCNGYDNGRTHTLHITGWAEHNGSDDGRPTWYWGHATFTVWVG